MYEEIIKVQKIIENIEDLAKMCNEVMEPKIVDLSLLGSIKDLIDTNLTADEHRLKTINYFITVSAMLYSPRCFVGRPMSRGLRTAIAVTLGVHSPTTISHIFSSVNVWLKHNRSFRDTVNRLYNIVRKAIDPSLLESEVI